MPIVIIIITTLSSFPGINIIMNIINNSGWILFRCKTAEEEVEWFNKF